MEKGKVKKPILHTKLTFLRGFLETKALEKLKKSLLEISQQNKEFFI